MELESTGMTVFLQELNLILNAYEAKSTPLANWNIILNRIIIVYYLYIIEFK